MSPTDMDLRERCVQIALDMAKCNCHCDIDKMLKNAEALFSYIKSGAKG